MDSLYQTEDDLKAAGFELTVNKFHTGNGDGKVYEKIEAGERFFFGVDVDGTVSPWKAASEQEVQPIVADVVPATEPTAEEVQPEE